MKDIQERFHNSFEQGVYRAVAHAAAPEPCTFLSSGSSVESLLSSAPPNN